MTTRLLTDDEKCDLEALNTAVARAIAARTDWLDAKSAEISSVKVGEELYDLHEGYCVGTVTAIKRWHRGHAEFDKSPSFYYEYEEKQSPPLPGEFPRCRFTNNTSHDMSTMRMGTKQEAAEALRRRAQYAIERADSMAAKP